MLNSCRELNDFELDFISGGLMPAEPGDGGGGGGGSVNVDTGYTMPSGLYTDQVYALEFVRDPGTGDVTVSLLLDSGSGGSNMTVGGDANVGFAKSGGDFATTAPVYPKCTVTVTSGGSRTSSTFSVSANIGIVSGSRSSTSVTTSKSVTISVEGVWKNNRCVVQVQK